MCCEYMGQGMNWLGSLCVMHRVALRRERYFLTVTGTRGDQQSTATALGQPSQPRWSVECIQLASVCVLTGE